MSVFKFRVYPEPGRGRVNVRVFVGEPNGTMPLAGSLLLTEEEWAELEGMLSGQGRAVIEKGERDQ
jgi:hypothetical protein